MEQDITVRRQSRLVVGSLQQIVDCTHRSYNSGLVARPSVVTKLRCPVNRRKHPQHARHCLQGFLRHMARSAQQLELTVPCGESRVLLGCPRSSQRLRREGDPAIDVSQIASSPSSRLAWVCKSVTGFTCEHPDGRTVISAPWPPVRSIGSVDLGRVWYSWEVWKSQRFMPS